MKHLKVFESFDDSDVRNPKFTDKTCYDFLTRLGISVTKSHGTYKSTNGEVPQEDNCDIRVMPSMKGGVDKVLYSFKVEKDSENFESYVADKQIKYKRVEAQGARYPYQIIIEK